MASGGDILGGAAQGAAAGAALGPVGAIAGGILGAIGGIFSSKAKKNKRKALKEQQKMAEREAAIQRRDMVRQLRYARSQALVSGASEDGGLESSSVLGALSSLAAQSRANRKHFDTQIQGQRNTNKYLGKAEKYAGYAQSAGAMLQLGGALISLAPNKSPTSSRGASSSGLIDAGVNQSLYAFEVKNAANIQQQIGIPVLSGLE